MELELISDFSQWNWGFPTVGTGVSPPWGAVSTREHSVFFPRLYYFVIDGMAPGPGGFHTVGGGVDPSALGFLPPSV